MKRFLAIALSFASVPGLALADPFDGAYIGIEGGYTKLTASLGGISVSDDSAIIGGTFGFRRPVGAQQKIIIGIEGNVDFFTNGSDFSYGASGILGYRTAGDWLIYGRGGYVRLDSDINIDGFLVGAGAEFLFSGNWSVRGDFRYIFFEDVLGVGLDGQEYTIGLNYNF
ncbi:MAG: porin family protein [Proteobacteria bacterium]|nr:porin family protein [Pseudomonadota bacterium]